MPLKATKNALTNINQLDHVTWDANIKTSIRNPKRETMKVTMDQPTAKSNTLFEVFNHLIHIRMANNQNTSTHTKDNTWTSNNFERAYLAWFGRWRYSLSLKRRISSNEYPIRIGEQMDPSTLHHPNTPNLYPLYSEMNKCDVIGTDIVLNNSNTNASEREVKKTILKCDIHILCDRYCTVWTQFLISCHSIEWSVIWCKSKKS